MQRRRCPASYLRAFRDATVTQLQALHAQKPAAISVWNPSCFRHTDNMCVAPREGANATEVRGQTLAATFAAWLGGDAPLLFDACGSAPDNETTPCNPHCDGCGSE